MFASQTQSLPDIQQEQLVWKDWKPVHPALEHRYKYSRVTLDDKIIILGGYKVLRTDDEENYEQALDIVILDPKKQTLKVLPPTGNDAKLICWYNASACYWEDNKIVVLGGFHPEDGDAQTSAGIVTLKDLDSENPSAHWEQIHPAQKIHCDDRLAHIYQDKMYVTGAEKHPAYAIWCLDLVILEWKKCEFTVNSFEKTPFLQFAASENIIYGIAPQKRTDTIIYEYNLDHFICKTINESKLSQRSGETSICRQVFDGKIYALTCPQYNLLHQPTTQPENEVLAYDIDLQKWIEIQLPNGSPSSYRHCHLLLCDDQLMLYEGWDDYDSLDLQKWWSLRLHPQKPSNNTSQISNLTKLQQTMKKFLIEAPYSDISFEVGSETIPAHKWWLTQRNKYFMNMFSSGMLETQASKITITDITPTAFRAFLEFLYSDHVELDYNLALELLQQANKYSVADLKTACEAYLADNIKPENFVNLGQVAELVEAASLRHAIVNYTGKNMKKLKQRSDFEQISDHLIRDSIVKFILK